MGIKNFNQSNEIRPSLPPPPPTCTTSWEKMTSSLTSRAPSHPPSPPKPEEMVMPPLPRPLPSRTSKKPLLPESSRDSMTDNHSSKFQKDEGHRRHAAINH